MDTVTLEPDTDLIAKCELGMTKPAPRTTLRRIAEGRMTLIVKGNDIYLDKQNGIPVRHTKNDRIGRTGSIMGLAASWPFVPLGFIDQDGQLTQKGRDFIARMDREDALNDVAPVIAPAELNSKKLPITDQQIEVEMIDMVHYANEALKTAQKAVAYGHFGVRESAATPKQVLAMKVLAEARKLLDTAQNKVGVALEELQA